MATSADINGLALDEQSFTWPLYRGAEAREIKLYGFGPRWDEYRAMAAALSGKGARITITGSRKAGGQPGTHTIVLPEVFITRATKVSETRIELLCFDSRLKLAQAVGDMDFNMSFGDDFLSGTEFPNYLDAIKAYCQRHPVIQGRLAADAFDGIPARPLEKNAHLSGLVANEPLAYLCDRANCDPVVGLDGKWYFASREDATPEWFKKFADEFWLERPGFLTIDSVLLQRPRNIISYYWEHHTIRAQGSNPGGSITFNGPAVTHVQLLQRYLHNGNYLTLAALLEAFGLSGTLISDADIARCFLINSAQGSALHPLDTFARKSVWKIIRRDWRTLWYIDFPSGNTGGWDQWRFGKIQADGSVLPVSVECPWIEFKRVIAPDQNNEFEGQPWTFNRTTKSPFTADWDNGPESGVIRLFVNSDGDRDDEVLPPRPGALTVPRPNGAGSDDALRIIGKDELDNNEGVKASSRNLNLMGREDISKARFLASFSIAIYLTGRRFLPNDNTRWHAESAMAFSDGDIEQVELPPSDEVQCYRTYVGGDAPAAEADGLGAILNATEVQDDGKRRAEVWKLTHALAATGEGRADTLLLASKPKVVNGPVQEVELHLDGRETFTMMYVGNLADGKAREMIADKRMAARKVETQGRKV